MAVSTFSERMMRARELKRQQLAYVQAQLRAGKAALAVRKEHQQRHHVTARQARADVRQVLRQLSDRAIAEADGNGTGYGRMLARVREVYRRALEASYFPAALDALRLESELMGFFPGDPLPPEVVRHREKRGAKRKPAGRATGGLELRGDPPR